jgi:hypothetical protein
VKRTLDIFLAVLLVLLALILLPIAIVMAWVMVGWVDEHRN